MSGARRPAYGCAPQIWRAAWQMVDAAGLVDAFARHSHVVVSGCGTRSMFLNGLFEYLTKHPCWEEVFAHLEGSAGVSSGCVVALALLVGADFTALCDALLELSRRHSSIAPCLDVSLAMESFGLDQGSFLQLTIDTVLDAVGLSTSTTFSSLHRLTKKDFRVCTTNLHSMKPCFFSHLTAPQMPLRDAIYMSMTVPFIFKPRRWMGELHVDGGVLDNYPTRIFGDGVTPLVLHMAWDVGPPPTSLCSFACAVASSTLYVQLERLEQWKREHPDSVCGVSDTNSEGEPVSLSSDTELLAAMRRRGFVRGMMCQRDEVMRLVTTVATYVARVECSVVAHASSAEPPSTVSDAGAS